MSSRVAPEDEAIIADLLELGEFDDSTQVIHEALVALNRQMKLDRMRALVQEGDDAYARGDYVEWTPELMDQIWEEAMEMNRLGLPLDPEVCG
jgi:Arc/MetJ-type ribon-helix-helix transcriptional regulator